MLALDSAGLAPLPGECVRAGQVRAAESSTTFCCRIPRADLLLFLRFLFVRSQLLAQSSGLQLGDASLRQTATTRECRHGRVHGLPPTIRFEIFGQNLSPKSEVLLIKY